MSYKILFRLSFPNGIQGTVSHVPPAIHLADPKEITLKLSRIDVAELSASLDRPLSRTVHVLIT